MNRGNCESGQSTQMELNKQSALVGSLMNHDLLVWSRLDPLKDFFCSVFRVVLPNIFFISLLDT